MITLDKNTQAFLALMRAGLWETDVLLSSFEPIDYNAVFKIAEEQSVVGLVAAGFEHIVDERPPKDLALTIAGKTLQIEQRNKAMNEFIALLINKLKEERVNAVLVKGQGVAQSYERPLWRACGDIDLLLDADNYEKAKEFLIPLSQSIEDSPTIKHLGLTIDTWMVELHGTLRSGTLHKMDSIIDTVQNQVFNEGAAREWRYGETTILLPEQNADVIFVFTHIIKHFFHEGIGLRQICDWCRLLYTYRDSLNRKLLESRLREMDLMTEWKTFAALTVDYLGMPSEAMPFYSPSKKWFKKAKRILTFIFETGNFGHNRDLSYYHNQPLLKQKAISLWRHTSDASKRIMIFPKDTICVWMRMFLGGLKAVL